MKFCEKQSMIIDIKILDFKIRPSLESSERISYPDQEKIRDLEAIE